MNVLELHARHKPRWNGDEWWKPDDFLWKVDWQAENLTTKIDRKGILGLIKLNHSDRGCPLPDRNWIQ